MQQCPQWETFCQGTVATTFPDICSYKTLNYTTTATSPAAASPSPSSSSGTNTSDSGSTSMAPSSLASTTTTTTGSSNMTSASVNMTSTCYTSPTAASCATFARTDADWQDDLTELCTAMPYMSGCSLWAICKVGAVLRRRVKGPAGGGRRVKW